MVFICWNMVRGSLYLAYYDGRPIYPSQSTQDTYIGPKYIYLREACTIVFSHNRYYFQLLETEVLIARGFFGIISHFGWKRVRIIIQDESLFTAVRETQTHTLYAWHTHRGKHVVSMCHTKHTSLLACILVRNIIAHS